MALNSAFILNPANTLTGFLTPKFIYIDFENRILPAARELLQKSFAANRLAAYGG